jgi:hypothetical protein
MNVATMPAALAGVQPDQVRVLWPYLRSWFELVEKTSKGRESAAELVQAIEESRAQLWIWWPSADEVKAICVTEITVHPGTKVCRIRVCVGVDRSEWLAAALPTIEAWAAQNGCDSVEPVARIGWERDLKALGYRKHHLLMAKAVPNEQRWRQ